jgi:hypothetical protein
MHFSLLPWMRGNDPNGPIQVQTSGNKLTQSLMTALGGKLPFDLTERADAQ